MVHQEGGGPASKRKIEKNAIKYGRTSATPHASMPQASKQLLNVCAIHHPFLLAGPRNGRVGYVGGILALRAQCALLLDYVPPEEPLGTALGNTLRIRRSKLDWWGP